MADTITYHFAFGRIGLHTDVPPLTVPVDGTHEDRLIDYLTLHLTTPGAEVSLTGHPDSLQRHAQVGAPGTPDHDKSPLATVASYLNDPTCNGKYKEAR